MKIAFCLPFIFIFAFSFSMEKADSAKSHVKLTGNISLNSNGFAPVPSFSLDAPALITAISVTKGRFSYDPQIAYGLNFKPWIIDNWLHYRIISNSSFELRTGIDFSMFFSNLDVEDYQVLQGQQYITLELAGIYKISPKSSITLWYWDDNGFGHGSIDGAFINMVYDRSDIKIGKKMLLSVNCQFYYVGYTGNNDGLFITPKISSAVRNIPISLFLQVTQALSSNIEPFPGFRWNLGVAYIF
jgi:hypothetical protein